MIKISEHGSNDITIDRRQIYIRIAKLHEQRGAKK